MSDTEKRDAVLREFRGRLFKVTVMADEIVRLRAEMGRLNRILAALLDRVREAYECAHMPVFKESDEIRRLRDENATLTAAIERVRALHTGRVVSSGLHRVCWECEMPFPCPTIRALEETP